MSELTEQMMDKIDNYLTGNLSPIESTQFESEIASNQSLQSEVDFQSDMINSIKENRRLELKSRLSKIEVSSKSKWFSNTAIGSMAASVLIAVVGFTYYEYSKFDNNPFISAQNQKVVSQFEVKTVENVNQVAEISTDENVNQIISLSAQIEGNDEEEPLDLSTVLVPEMDINESENNEVSNNSLASIEELKSVNIITSGAENVEITFKKTRNKKLAYKFFDQKLFLYGKFDEASPYEVIEIKTQFGKEFYLKFDKNYYTIKKGIVEKTSLAKIKNAKLINKLENLD